jgi:hypothetical protein
MAASKHHANVEQTNADDEVGSVPAFIAANQLAHMGVAGHA